MTCTAKAESGAIEKTDRSKLEKLVVLAFKPPFVDQNTKVPYVVFINERGDEVRLPAVPDVWRLVDGAPRPGKRSVSLTTDTRRKFVIYVAKRQGQNQNVVSLTNYPHEDFLHTRAFGAPEDNTEDVRFKVHPTTGSVTIVSVPTGAKLPQLMAMVAVLDKATRIEAGMSLGADSEVLSVTGLEFSASLAVTPADTPGASMTMA